MARIEGTQGTGAIADRVRERRGGELRPIDEMLLHSPEVTEGWNQLVGALRERLVLPASLREMVILRVGVLNEAQYEWDSHVAPAQRAGVTQAQLDALMHLIIQPTNLFSQSELVALEYTEVMTRSISVPDSLFDTVVANFTPQELVELTALIAAYNMVSRFAVALDISEHSVGAHS